MDAFHRVMAGAPVSRRQLRAAGIVVVIWIAMDVIQWLDWLVGKFSHASICGGG